MNRRKALALLLATPAAFATSGCTNIFSPPTEIPRRPPMRPPPPIAPQNSVALVEDLKLAYSKRDWDTLAALLHPDFMFVLNAAAADGTVAWDRAEELSVHRRMFRPGSIGAGEAQLRSELWLASIDILLFGATSWDVLPDAGGPLEHALYNATVFFETQGETDFRVESQQEFVVRKDPGVAVGEPGRFLLYRWIDRGAPSGGLLRTGSSWSDVKRLYRATPRPAPVPAGIPRSEMITI